MSKWSFLSGLPGRLSWPVWLLHWCFTIALGLCFVTGLRIAADALNAPLAQSLSGWLPQGAVFFWHLLAGSLVLSLTLAYVGHQVGTGQWRRFLPARFWANAPGMPWHRWILAMHWLLFVLLMVSISTGLLQYTGWQASPGASSETLHRMAAWGFWIYLLGHLATQWASGGAARLAGALWPRGVRAGAVWALSMVPLAWLALWSLDRIAIMDLAIPLTDHPPSIDGQALDSAWDAAVPARLRLGNGANLPGGATEVHLRALRDDQRLYLLCEWDDPTRSQKHVPLLKTEAGWRILQTAYRRADENVYYEDKFALMLAVSDPLAALTAIHLGPHPLAGQPGAPGGRGLHYTQGRRILDVWHWKSVRNGAEHQADDNFFSAPLPAPAATPRQFDPDSGAWFPRYTAGYRKDPPGTFAGYNMNWENFTEGVATPLRLPDDARDLAALADATAAAHGSDPGSWWLEFNDTHPFAQGEDNLPVGTLLPSVLSTGKLTGDRGDIQARGRWARGRWTLELSRALDTGSDKDVPIQDGVLVWVAVFDHTQTRHAYHLRPLRLRLLPD